MKPISRKPKRHNAHSSSEAQDEDVSLPCAKSTGDNNTTTNTNTMPICKYGSSCYRKNPDHLRQFRHPHRENDNKEELEEEGEKKDPDQAQNKAEDEDEDQDQDQKMNHGGDEEDNEAQEAFLISPGGTEWWNIDRCSTRVSTSGGVIGYDRFSMNMEYDDDDQAKAKYTSWLEAKLRSGWCISKDPRMLDSVKEEVFFLVANDNPPHWPHKRRWKLKLDGVNVETSWANGGRSGQQLHSFSRWYGTVDEARAQAMEWVRKKTDQGYHQVLEPKLLWFRGRWDCPDRDACPYLSHSEHLEYYYHKIGPDIDPQQLEASCHNPVLVEAWNIQQPKYVKTIGQATPHHVKPLAGMITEYLQPSFQSCWKPTCVEQKDVPITRSKIGGRPYISKGDTWPTCGECDDPLTFLVQLNLSELPSEASCALGDSNHMIQLFICMNNDRECGEAQKAFGRGNLVRRIIWTEEGGQTKLVVPPSSTAHEIMYRAREKVITGWVEQVDRVLADDDWYPQLKAIEGDDEIFEPWNEADEERGIPDAACDGDKLCGFCRYEDGPAYPTCPACASDSNKTHTTHNRRKQKQKLHQDQDSDDQDEDGDQDGDGDAQSKHRMRYVFQVAGEDQIAPFIDVGCGHIYQCAIHKDVLAFSWLSF